MSKTIHFKHNLSNRPVTQMRKELQCIKVTIDLFPDYVDIIQKSIDLFNKEIQWESMWDINEAHHRLLNKNSLYLLIEKDTPLGHVWYNGNYLYNAYVSSNRIDGDSEWFIVETMNRHVSENNLDNIELDVDSWNKRAIRFWEKIGYIMTS